jgi:hypothetical protein
MAAGGGPGRDVARRCPLIDPHPDEVGDRSLAWLDVASFSHRCDELGELDLRLALRAAEGVILNLSLACGRVASGIELEFE